MTGWMFAAGLALAGIATDSVFLMLLGVVAALGVALITHAQAPA